MSGAEATVPAISCYFFLPREDEGDDVLNRRIISLNTPQFLGDIASPIPSQRIMNSLGSRVNKDNFYLLEAKINGMKKRVRTTKLPRTRQTCTDGIHHRSSKTNSW